jgi:hypothetical protein
MDMLNLKIIYIIRKGVEIRKKLKNKMNLLYGPFKKKKSRE